MMARPDGATPDLKPELALGQLRSLAFIDAGRSTGPIVAGHPAAFYFQYGVSLRKTPHNGTRNTPTNWLKRLRLATYFCKPNFRWLCGLAGRKLGVCLAASGKSQKNNSIYLNKKEIAMQTTIEEVG